MIMKPPLMPEIPAQPVGRWLCGLVVGRASYCNVYCGGGTDWATGRTVVFLMLLS
jgi:hypothetical protein